MAMPPADAFEATDSTPSRALTIDQLAPGQSAFQRIVFDERMMALFAEIAQDRAPVHTDERFAREAGFDRPIVQGLAVSTRFSRLIGMYLPGEHAILETIQLKYRRPVFVGQDLIYSAVIDRLMKPLRVVRLDLKVTSGDTTHVTGWCQCLVR